MTKRRTLTDREKDAIRAAQGGKCAGLFEVRLKCERALPTNSDADFDHIAAHKIVGDESLENFRALCPPCHKIKTARDVKAIAKMKRLERQRAGLPKRKRMIKKIPNRPNAWPKGRKLQSRNTFRSE